jgi:hypothetical protein
MPARIATCPARGPVASAGKKVRPPTSSCQCLFSPGRAASPAAGPAHSFGRAALGGKVPTDILSIAQRDAAYEAEFGRWHCKLQGRLRRPARPAPQRPRGSQTALRSAHVCLARSPLCPAPPGACSRAARFGVSPTTACSCAAPWPIRWPTHDEPVAIPTPHLQRYPRRGVKPGHGVDQCEPGSHRALCVVLVSPRIAGNREHPVAHVSHG